MMHYSLDAETWQRQPKTRSTRRSCGSRESTGAVRLELRVDHARQRPGLPSSTGATRARWATV
jgi:hypothetical protein